jgi:hypothetical protein
MHRVCRRDLHDLNLTSRCELEPDAVKPARLTPKGSSNWDPAPSAGPRGVSSLSEIPLLSDIPFR